MSPARTHRGGRAGGGRGAGTGAVVPGDLWEVMFRMAATVGEEPPVLRPLDRDLCLAAYGVTQEHVTRELQWRCGRGSGVGIRNFDGQACFVNAVAQVLLRVAPVRHLEQRRLRVPERGALRREVRRARHG